MGASVEGYRSRNFFLKNENTKVQGSVLDLKKLKNFIKWMEQ